MYYSNLKTVPFLWYHLFYYMLSNDTSFIKDYEDLANNFSYAFQIADDFEDEEKDKQKKLNNHILFLGKTKAYDLYRDCLTKFRYTLKKLKINSVFFEQLLNLLEDKMSIYHTNV